ncbi:MAG: hypothetical protein M3022_08240 [Actinomycetota bacterium]|nr:hypothetical protein [Actinomycetota bacterium]
MRRLLPGSRGSRSATAVVVFVMLVALIDAGLGTVTPRTYALRAPNQFPLLTLAPGSSVCEGPVTSATPVRAVGIWGAALGAPAGLRLSARTASGTRVLAAGTTVARTDEAEQQVELKPEVAGGIALLVCVTDLRGRFSIAGSPAIDAKIVMTGTPTGREFSLLLLDQRRSLFSALPSIFSRAALFRPSWMGAWTFWMLGAGLLGGFALAVVAVARAVSADAQADEEA